MAKILVFKYHCGWEYPVRMLPGQWKVDLVSRLGPSVRRRHRRTCETCRPTRLPDTSRLSSSQPD
jgi:hypothetical protein